MKDQKYSKKLFFTHLGGFIKKDDVNGIDIYDNCKQVTQSLKNQAYSSEEEKKNLIYKHDELCKQLKKHIIEFNAIPEQLKNEQIAYENKFYKIDFDKSPMGDLYIKIFPEKLQWEKSEPIPKLGWTYPYFIEKKDPTVEILYKQLTKSSFLLREGTFSSEKERDHEKEKYENVFKQIEPKLISFSSLPIETQNKSLELEKSIREKYKKRPKSSWVVFIIVALISITIMLFPFTNDLFDEMKIGVGALILIFDLLYFIFSNTSKEEKEFKNMQPLKNYIWVKNTDIIDLHPIQGTPLSEISQSEINDMFYDFFRK